MDQALKTMLFAQATAEVIDIIRNFAEIETSREKTLEFANELGAKLGLPKIDATQLFEAEFAKAKSEFDAYIECMARAEIKAAEEGAELEQIFYASKRDELNHMLADQLSLIKNRTLAVNDEFDTRIFYNQLAGHIRSSHAGLMKVVQQLHRESLRFVFSVHLIEQETVAKLVDLYEVK